MLAKVVNSRSRKSEANTSNRLPALSCACCHFLSLFLLSLLPLQSANPIDFSPLRLDMLLLSAARTFLAAAVAFQAVAAHNIVLPARGVECFHESLHRDDKMTVTFQVGDREFGSAGNLDIDFWV